MGSKLTSIVKDETFNVDLWPDTAHLTLDIAQVLGHPYIILGQDAFTNPDQLLKTLKWQLSGYIRVKVIQITELVICGFPIWLTKNNTATKTKIHTAMVLDYLSTIHANNKKASQHSAKSHIKIMQVLRLLRRRLNQCGVDSTNAL